MHKHQAKSKEESYQGLASVFFVFAVRKLSPEDEECRLNEVQPDCGAEEDLAVHLEKRT